MREILFRGKRVENGEWVYGYYAKSVWETGLLSNPIIRTSHQIWYDMDNRHQVYAEIIPETVGEWTGLTDRNGVKIFEGDIIKARYREHNYPNNWSVGYVVFENGTFKMKVTENNNAIKHTQYCGEKVLAFSIENNFIERYYKLEVIGNIYDNKDLL